MERYSTLNGTEQSGSYKRLGSSKHLANFLTQKVGASDAIAAMVTTETLIAGISMLPGYEKETLSNKPLAVVYAPLYLGKILKTTTDMKGFCALAVSGLEHLDERESSYSHTWFFPREDMLTAGEYNYLDQLMGTPLTTSQDVNLHRKGSLPVDLDRLPQKVHPRLVRNDLPAVLVTIDALYQKKNVVLVLEEGVNFNRRSMELLTQIYSLMQPMLATETGFATYQSQERIQALSAKTNVQIYVVPAGSELNSLPADKFRILDLSKPIGPVASPVVETLVKWANWDWNLRSRAMAHLFAKNDDYANGDHFVKLSREFFAQAEDLSSWLRDTSKHKSLTTLAELQAEDKTETGWKLVPWAREAFNKKYPELLKDKVELLNARNIAAFYEYHGADQDLKERSKGTVDPAAVNSAARQYQYGRTLAPTDESELCRLVWEKADQRVGVGYRAEIDDLKAHEETLKQEHEQAVESLNLKHEQAVDTLKQEHQQQIEGKDREIADNQQKFESAWNNREADYQKKSTEREAAHQEALTVAIAAEAAKTAAVQAKLDEADKVHADHVATLTQEHQNAMEQQKQAADNALNTLRKQASDRVSELTSANVALSKDLEQANLDKGSLQTSLTQAKQRYNAMKSSLEQANQDKGRLQNDLNDANLANTTLQSELNTATQSYASLAAQYQAATGQPPPTLPVPTRPVPTPPDDPKPELPKLAIIGAAALILGMLLGFLISGLLNRPATYEIQWSANNVVNNAANMGTVTLSDDKAQAGETITVTVKPSEGWQVDSVDCMFGSALTKVSDTEYTFVMPEQEETILIAFSELPPPTPVYEIQWTANGQTGNAGEMGTVELSKTEAEAGETITVTVTPAEGWLLDEVKCQSGAALTDGTDGVYTFVMPEQNETIQVTFSEIPPEPTALNEDGTINWEYLVEEVSWVHTTETDSEAMAKILGDKAIKSKDWVQEGILLPEGWDTADKNAVNPYILVLRRAASAAAPEETEPVETEPEETEPEETKDTESEQAEPTETEPAETEPVEQRDTAALKLLKKGWLVVDNGDRCLVIPAKVADAQDSAWTKTMRAAMKVMDLLTDKDNNLDVLAYELDNKAIIDLQEMASAAGMSDAWWMELDKISFDATDAENVSYTLKTTRTAILTVELDDGTNGIILDYSGNSNKGDEMVGIAEGKGRNASHVGNYVLVMLNGTDDKPAE